MDAERLTIERILDGAAREADPPLVKRRGRGLQRSDLLRHVGVALLHRAWPASTPTPRRGSPLNAHEAAVVQHVAPTLIADLRHGDQAATVVIDQVRERCAALGTCVTDSSLSELVAVRVARLVREGRPVHEPIHLEAVVADVSALVVHNPRAMSVDAFVEAGRAPYDRCWVQRGEENLDSHAPSRWCLGHDVRPPLAAAFGHRASTTWMIGTDRPLYDRYRLRFARSARSRPSARRRHQCPGDLPATAALDPLELVVDAACSPLGCAMETHVAVLSTLVTAVEPPQAGTRRAGTYLDWDTSCAPLDEEETLVLFGELARAVFHQWWHRRSRALARLLGRTADVVVHGDPDLRSQGAAGGAASSRHDRRVSGHDDLEAFLAPLTVVVMRKAWMALQRREREYAAPVRLCSAMGVVRSVSWRGLEPGLRQYLAAGEFPPPPDVRRAQATWTLLADAYESIGAEGCPFLPPAEGWEAAYTALVERTAGRAASDTYLTGPEVRAHLASAMSNRE